MIRSNQIKSNLLELINKVLQPLNSHILLPIFFTLICATKTSYIFHLSFSISFCYFISFDAHIWALITGVLIISGEFFSMYSQRSDCLQVGVGQASRQVLWCVAVRFWLRAKRSLVASGSAKGVLDIVGKLRLRRWNACEAQE